MSLISDNEPSYYYFRYSLGRPPSTKKVYRKTLGFVYEMLIQYNSETITYIPMSLCWIFPLLLECSLVKVRWIHIHLYCTFFSHLEGFSILFNDPNRSVHYLFWEVGSSRSFSSLPYSLVVERYPI